MSQRTLNGRNEPYGRRRRWFASIREYDDAMREMIWDHDAWPYAVRDVDCDGVFFDTCALGEPRERADGSIGYVLREGVERLPWVTNFPRD